jgi:hypothetical protein
MDSTHSKVLRKDFPEISKSIGNSKLSARQKTLQTERSVISLTKMKVYSIDYRRDKYVRIYFGCDDSLDPTNNTEDYNYVVGLAELGYLG